MRIPKDIPLTRFIRQLIDKDKMYIFYKTDDWKELRQQVLEDKYYECQMCLKKGRYTRADCVHHVNEVRNRPELALSRTYIDMQGNEKENLMPLCNNCHNAIHDKLGEWQRKDKFNNEERW